MSTNKKFHEIDLYFMSFFGAWTTYLKVFLFALHVALNHCLLIIFNPSIYCVSSVYFIVKYIYHIVGGIFIIRNILELL